MKTPHPFLFGAALVGAGALGGCETIVNVDVPPHQPKLSLSYTLSNQAPTADYRQSLPVRNLFVGTSKGVLDTRPLTGRTDATVVLRDAAGEVVEQFERRPPPTSSADGPYRATRNFAGQPGQTYTLEASAPGVEPVTATLTLPAVPTIETAAYAVRTTGSTGFADNAGRLTLSVLDDAATADYYLVYARALDADGRFWGTVRLDYSVSSNDGPILLDRLQLSEGDNLSNQEVFSDAGANGQRLNLAADVRLFYRGGYSPGNPTPRAAYIEVVVSNVTADTYRFYQSLRRYYDTDGNPFAEPAPLFSSFPNGYGVFGGASDAVYRIRL